MVVPTSRPKQVCFNTSILVDSEGIWGDEKLYNYTQPTLQFQIILILGAQQALHFFLGFVGLPTVVSQISVGVAFGALFKKLDLQRQEINSKEFFSDKSQEILSTLAHFGFILALFLAGVKMDPKTVFKRAGRKALAIGFGSVFLPALTAVTSTTYLVRKWYPIKNRYLLRSAYSLSGLHSASTFPVIVALLSEMEILTSELGRLAICSAIVRDATLSFLLLGILLLIHLQAQTTSGFVFLFIILFGVVFLIRPILIWFIKQTPERRQVKNVYVVAVIIGVLALTSTMQHFQVLGLLDL